MSKAAKAEWAEASVDEAAFARLRAARRVTLVRAAERVDRVFPEWLRGAFDEAGRYQPRDLNLPPAVPRRPEGPAGFADDAPLTAVGAANARLLGRGLRVGGLWPPDAVVCSPALRCVEIAARIVEGAAGRKGDVGVRLCVEPALFDFCGWYERLPSFLPPASLRAAQLPVAADYAPQMAVEELGSLVGVESRADFHARVQKTVEALVRDGRRVLLVVHAPVMLAAMRTLRGAAGELTERELLHLGARLPPGCSFTFAAEGEGPWSFVHEPVPSFSFLGASNRADGRFLERALRPAVWSPE